MSVRLGRRKVLSCVVPFIAESKWPSLEIPFGRNESELGGPVLVKNVLVLDFTGQIKRANTVADEFVVLLWGREGVIEDFRSTPRSNEVRAVRGFGWRRRENGFSHSGVDFLKRPANACVRRGLTRICKDDL